MSDVFISYARQERARAEQLASALKQFGFSVWWDSQLAAGDRWANLIEQQLEKASCVVVLWSPESVANAWVRDEAAYGRELNKLIPVVIENVVVPLGFRALQSGVLTDWNGESNHPGFLELVEAIRLRVQDRA